MRLPILILSMGRETERGATQNRANGAKGSPMKMHAIAYKGKIAFIRCPKGQKPRVTRETFARIFNIPANSCFSVNG